MASAVEQAVHAAVAVGVRGAQGATAPAKFMTVLTGQVAVGGGGGECRTGGGEAAGGGGERLGGGGDARLGGGDERAGGGDARTAGGGGGGGDDAGAEQAVRAVRAA